MIKKKILFKKFNVNFEKGNIYKIDGKNGSGKSTLLFILMGLLQPLSGKVLINGKRIKNWNKVIQRICLLLIKLIFLNKSILDNISLNNSN